MLAHPKKHGAHSIYQDCYLTGKWSIKKSLKTISFVSSESYKAWVILLREEAEEGALVISRKWDGKGPVEER